MHISLFEQKLQKLNVIILFVSAIYTYLQIIYYSANSQKQTGTDIRSEDAGPAALSSGQGIGLTRPRHSACENATHVHRLFRKRGYRGGIRIRVRRDYRRGFGRRRAISVSAA